MVLSSRVALLFREFDAETEEENERVAGRGATKRLVISARGSLLNPMLLHFWEDDPFSRTGSVSFALGKNGGIVFSLLLWSGEATASIYDNFESPRHFFFLLLISIQAILEDGESNLITRVQV